MSYPNYWQSVNLFELCQPKQWKTISTKDLLPEGYTVYGANGPIGFYSNFTHEHPTLMITCRGATCGNLHVSKPFSYINGNAMSLDGLITEACTQNYLRYFLAARGFEDVISGSAQPQITREGLRKIDVPLAPLPEQKRIADKLDATLARVDACRARLERVAPILKRFRLSVLAAATSGQLTADWREQQGHGHAGNAAWADENSP
ncbi:MAG: restriction endonuclease subunit S, partial [Vogesella sp.]|uniref:restriction endonuclease subunit S n=1 Tax=Vogesella sp. TaxID=1904252 RepID=UPI003F313F04